MTELSNGLLETAVPERGRRDEIGDMAAALQVFKDNALALKNAEGHAAEQQRLADEARERNEQERAAAARQVAQVVDALGRGLERLAKGDLSYRVNEQLAGEYKKVQDDFNAAIAQLHETIRSIVESTREVSNAAAQTSNSTTDLSQRTEEQAAGLEQTTATMEQISVTVRKNSENAQQASQFAVDTRAVASRGGEVVAEAVNAMARIEESSRKIADIIVVIDEIARQTNLLALNAAVEAARAGEAGRGFAVVASEVRSLAQRSSQAAKDIKDLITRSSGQVQDGVDLVNRAGTSLHEIVGSIERVANIVSDIAVASSSRPPVSIRSIPRCRRWTSVQQNSRWSRRAPQPPRRCSTIGSHGRSRRLLPGRQCRCDERFAGAGAAAQAARQPATAARRAQASASSGCAPAKPVGSHPPACTRSARLRSLGSSSFLRSGSPSA
jgi:methyl-accepting chemotaxis protein